MGARAVRREERQAGLEAEGARVAGDFGLGRCTGAWTATRYRERFKWGLILLVLILPCLFFLPLLPWPGPGRAVVGGCYGGAYVVAVLMMALPPRSWRDRLFRCDAGIVLLAGQAAEPAVLRWADLAAMSLKVVSGYVGDYVATCELTDRVGSRVAVESAFGAAEAITAEAERLLAPRLAPGQIRRYDAAEPLTFGRLTVDQSGLGYADTEPGTWAWRIPWPEIRRVEIRMHGHRIVVRWGKRQVRRVLLDSGPNGFLARYVIEHAAFGHADVTADGKVSLWDVATRTVRATLTDRAEDRYAAAEGFPEPGVQALAFGDHGRLLAVTFDDGATDMWAVATGRRVAVAGGGKVGTYVANVAFSPDGRLLVTSDDSGNITEWDVSVSRVTR